MNTKNSKTRFSDRVGDYIKYRPSYPREIINTLQSECGLHSASIVADVGSGTGILSQLFLDQGYTVIGVEPNRDMRQAAEAQLQQFHRFLSVDGSAENTTLDSNSVDFIVAGQAFHWFNNQATKNEFKRILRDIGTVALIWNERETDTTEFLKGYEALLIKYGTDYTAINHKNIEKSSIDAFFSPATCLLARFPNRQVFDLDGLIGRALSSSYVPNRGQANHEAIMQGLRDLFAQTNQEQSVSFDYITTMYYGCL